MNRRIVSSVTVATNDSFEWRVWRFNDGTYQLVRMYRDRTIVGATGCVDEVELRAAMAEHGIVGDVSMF